MEKLVSFNDANNRKEVIVSPRVEKLRDMFYSMKKFYNDGRFQLFNTEALNPEELQYMKQFLFDNKKCDVAENIIITYNNGVVEIEYTSPYDESYKESNVLIDDYSITNIFGLYEMLNTAVSYGKSLIEPFSDEDFYKADYSVFSKENEPAKDKIWNLLEDIAYITYGELGKDIFNKERFKLVVKENPNSNKSYLHDFIAFLSCKEYDLDSYLISIPQMSDKDYIYSVTNIRDYLVTSVLKDIPILINSREQDCILILHNLNKAELTILDTIIHQQNTIVGDNKLKLVRNPILKQNDEYNGYVIINQHKSSIDKFIENFIFGILGSLYSMPIEIYLDVDLTNVIRSFVKDKNMIVFHYNGMIGIYYKLSNNLVYLVNKYQSIKDYTKLLKIDKRGRYQSLNRSICNFETYEQYNILLSEKTKLVIEINLTNGVSSIVDESNITKAELLTKVSIDSIPFSSSSRSYEVAKPNVYFYPHPVKGINYFIIASEQIDYTASVLKPILVNYLKAQLENFYLIDCKDIILDKEVLSKFNVDIASLIKYLAEELQNYHQIEFIKSIKNGLEIGIYSISDSRDIYIKIQ